YFPFIGNGQYNNPLLLGVTYNIKCSKETIFCTLKQK
ncbi:LD-carboxypeptidase, partial [Francisella tularensis subsp. holarctica]|nr:LD-carboxypeptidase [Francisella tularensis subsp. holarctica]